MTDQDLLEMKRYYDRTFLRHFESGVHLYIEGYWPEAKAILQDVERIKGYSDTPTRKLMQFMKQYNYIAPDDWKNHRVFGAK